MRWIHYIAGKGKSGKLIAMAIGMDPDPDAVIAKYDDLMPFTIELIGLEEGSQERLEELRTRFRPIRLHGPWYKPTAELVEFVEGLKPIDRMQGSKRVSLDLMAEEFSQLEAMVKELGTVTKARLLRRALRFYLALGRYKARGYALQAIKDGKLIQFPDLEHIKDPP